MRCCIAVKVRWAGVITAHPCAPCVRQEAQGKVAEIQKVEVPWADFEEFLSQKNKEIAKLVPEPAPRRKM